MFEFIKLVTTVEKLLGSTKKMQARASSEKREVMEITKADVSHVAFTPDGLEVGGKVKNAWMCLPDEFQETANELYDLVVGLNKERGEASHALLWKLILELHPDAKHVDRRGDKIWVSGARPE